VTRRKNSKHARGATSFLVANLRSLTLPDLVARSEARAILDDVWPPVEALAELVVNHPDGRVRTAAAMRLGVQGPDNRTVAVQALRSAVYDPMRHVVRGALRSLKRLGAPEAVHDYVGALAGPDAQVVIAAIEAIAALGAPAMGAHLVPVLRRPRKRLQLAALLGIERLNWREAAPELVRFLDSLRGERRVAGIDFNVPTLCIRLLGAWRVREASPVLVQVVMEEVGLRSKALAALQKLRCPEAAAALLPLLAQAFGDAHADDLALMMLELMLLADYRASIAVVRRYLSHRNWVLRRKALEIVGAWRDVEAADAVRAVCHHDGSEFVRPEAARALARIIGPAAAPDLARLVDALNPAVRLAANESLDAIRTASLAGVATPSGG
jgi:HEAT repeat protein